MDNNNDNDNNNNIKQITINGTGTKYEMKKVLKEKKEPKIRVDSEKWQLTASNQTKKKCAVQVNVFQDLFLVCKEKGIRFKE